MVAPEEYFYYLKCAFKKNHIHGYMIGKKRNHKTCIYQEDDKWVVACVKRDVVVDPAKYNDIWPACEEIIARVSKDEVQRKRVWMDWASPSNCAEKMDEPLKVFPVKQARDTEVK